MRMDPDRLAELRRLLILDSSGERAYDDIARLLAVGLEVPITIVNLLDENRDWFKACVGLAQKESPASTSFCEVLLTTTEEVVVVSDTLNDERFADHPLVVGPPHIRFYAAARLVARGQTVGSLCAYDVVPRQISAEQMDQLRTLAGAAMDLLMARGADRL